MKGLKLGAVTMAYRDQGTIRGTLACLANYVKRHIVLLQDKPFYGEYESPDNTEAICNEFSNVEVIKGNWPEHVARNIGVNLCNDLDWIICFDADEMMTKDSLDRLISWLPSCEHDAVAIIAKVYWKSIDYRFEPYPEHNKIIVTKPTVVYYDTACMDKSYILLRENNDIGVTHHHLSFAEPKDIYSKVVHYNHADQFDGKSWYEKYFKNWKPGEPVYQPFMTKWEAVYDPLPEELAQYIKDKNA